MSEANSKVIAALEAALSVSPENHDLRAHLAEVLLTAGRSADALKEASSVIQEVPDHLSALETAMKAAHALGKNDRAERYAKLLRALGEAVSEPVSSPPAVVPSNTVELDETVAKEDDDEEEAGEPQKGPSKIVPLRVVAGGTADDAWRVEQSELKLSDVAGLEAVKRRLELSVFALLRHADMRQYFGRSIRGGLLLYGPPGCGKTFVARATAGELGARFLAVGLNDVLDMWFGESERKLHEMFETARRNAPCVLFFDEIDALGRKRTLQRVSSGHNIVNQLLSEMDSIGAKNDGLFILGATNHLWDVDTALRRPGRFDRVIFVGPPDAPAREAILEFHMRDRTSDGIDWGSVAGKSTEGFSGADLAHLCDTAAEHAMEESMRSGKMRPIARQDFQAALKEVRPSTRPWLETARDYAKFANEGGVYDDLLEYLRVARLM